MHGLAERRSTGRKPFRAFVKAAIPSSLLCLLACLLALHVVASGVRSRRAYALEGHARASEARELAPGSLRAQELPAGSSRLYKIVLRSGQHARVLVLKDDLRLTASLFGPEGQPSNEFHGERYGPLRVSFIARASGAHYLEIRSLEKGGAARRYDLELEAVREATAADALDEGAEKLFAEAERLRSVWNERALREAAERYADASRHWQTAARYERAAESLRAIGEVFLTLGEYQKARAAFNRALASSRAAGDASGRRRALNDICRVLIYLGNNRQALAHCESVLALYRRRARAGAPAAEDLRGEAEALNNRGEIHYSLGEFREALDHFNRALGLWDRANDREGQARARLNLGYTYADSGGLPKAWEHLRQALALWQALDDQRGEALSRTAMGAVESFHGRRQSALDSHKQALQIFRAIGDRHGEAVTLNSIGQVYEDLNEPRTALDYYQLALALYQGNKSGDAEAVTQYYIGRVFRALGDDEQALAHYQRSLALARALGKRRVEAYAVTDISSINYSRGKKAVALRQLEEGLKVYRSAGDRRGQAATLKSIADIHYSSGARRRATSFYERALALSRLAADSSGQASILYDMARVERDSGNVAEALNKIQESISIIETLRVQVASQRLRSSYFASVHKHYGLYIALLMQMHSLRPEAGYAVAAFEANEGARARSLLETLLEADADLRLGADRALLERERALQQMLNAKAIYQMRLLNSPRATSDAEDVEKEIRQLTSEYDEVQAQLRLRNPRYAGLTQPQALKLEEIQSMLGDGAMLLEYALGDERSYLWAVTAQTFASYELPGRVQIEEAAREVYRLLTARQVESESTADYRERVLKADEQYRRASADLSRVLLGQVAAQLGGRRLLIVADGALQYIPFDALPYPEAHGPVEGQSATSGETGGEVSGESSDVPSGESSDEAHPLILKHEVVYLPSASTLVALRRGAARETPAPNVVMVLADPVFDTSDPRARAVAAAPLAPEERAIPLALRSIAGRDSGSVISRLPATLEEAETIMSLTPWGEGTLATGFEANRTIVLGEELSRYRIVHFATHGVINNEHPELSGIVLSMVNARGEQENGFLQLHDIYNLKLSADLVVLNACSTGLGKEVKGEGLVGLTRGFMYAGADAVVASLWKVDDRASAEFTKHFYSAMLRDGLAPSAALRAAKEKMWRQKRWRSPFYWAAFVLQGEYRQSVRPDDYVRRVVLFTAAAALALGLMLALFRPLVMRRSRAGRRLK
jgi:CHAT domain-containing protein